MASTNFINECKNRANANRLGQLIIDGIDNPITQSDKLQSFTIDSGCYVDGNIIGSVYVKKLTGKILDSANVSLVDKTIQAKLGVKYADNSTEYLNVGKYTVERPTAEKTANMSEFTAYNGLKNKLDDKYVCNIDYSKGNITLTNLYKDVCSQMNLTPTTITFDNSSIPISANPFTNGEKNRTVLQVIAKIAGAWIEIDDDSNEVDLHWLSQNSEPDYIFNLNDYSTVEGGEITCGPINCLIIKNSQVDDENITITDDESIALYGENSIVINEDYILYNSDLRQQAINAIWNKVHGLNYVDCKLITYYGKPFLKLGDKIRIYTNETEYFDTYVLKHNFTYDGTFTSVIESPVLTKQEIKNKQNVSLGELLRNTRIDVNKQDKKINLAVEIAQEAYDKVEVYNPVLESTGNGQLSLPDCAGEKLLEFSVDGKSEQATRSGYNLAKTPYKSGTSKTQNGITFTVNKDGSIKMSGTSTGTAYFDIYEDGANMLINESFTCSTGSSNADIEMQYYEHINSWQFKKATINGLLTTTPNASATGQLFRIIITSGKTVNETLFPMILKGIYSSNTIPPFEPYGVSPSPDYPSEIKSINGVENLFNKDGGFINAFVTYDGKIQNANNNAVYDYYEVDSNTTYTLQTSESINGLSVSYFDENKNFIIRYNNLVSGSTKKASFTPTDATKYIRINVNYDNSTTMTQEIIDTLNIMLEKGSVAHDFVPYGSNYLVEKVVGKNKFNKDNTNILNTSFSSSNPNLVTSPQGRTIYIPCKPNTTYTVQKVSSTRFWVGYTTEIPAIDSSTASGVVGGTDGITNVSITTGSNANYLLAYVYKSDTDTLTLEEILDTLMIEEGSQATEYEEYKEAISLIDLKGYELRSVGDFKDELIIKNGQALINKNIKKIILDGSEAWSLSGTEGDFSRFTTWPSDNKIASKFKCDKFPLHTQTENLLQELIYERDISKDGALQIRILNSRLATIDNTGFKAWLSENPITVQYELATPEIINLGEVSIETVQSDCTLELEEELETDMYAKYIKNNPYNEAYSTRLDTKAQIQLSENKIESSVSETILQNTELMQGEIDSLSSNLANNYMTSEEVQNLNNLTNESLAVITNEFKQIQTSTQTQFQAITNILQNGVNLVKTTYTTIDDEGIKIAKSTDSFNSTFDNRGLKLYSYTDLMAVYTNKGAGVTNLLVTGTMDLGYSKIMKVTQNGKKYTGIFYSDAMAQTLEDFIGE